MFLNHPYAQLVANEMERHRRQQVHARRRAAPGSPWAATMRQRLGAALVGAGTKLQGAGGAAFADPASAAATVAP